MADPIRKDDKHYTYRDYCTWPDKERWELIDGVAWNMSTAPSTNHRRVLRDLYDVFRAAIHSANATDSDRTGCEVLFAPLDVFLFTDESDEIFSVHTMRKDITVKLDLYERAGVKEYWMIDPGNQAILLYRLGDDGRYPEALETIQAPGTAASKPFPDLRASLPFASAPTAG